MRQSLNALSYFAIVMIFYFAAVLFLTWFGGRPSDSPLAKEARSIIWALQEYRAARGTFPILPAHDSPLIDLKKELAKDGFFRPEPSDFAEPDREARYVLEGNSFGLLFHVDRSDNNPSGLCLIEFGARATKWWGQPPRCQF